MKKYHAWFNLGGSYWYETLSGATGAIIRTGGGRIVEINKNAKTVREIKITVKGGDK